MKGRAAAAGRTDRLLEIIQILRDGQSHRAEDIAQHFGVSLRTIYRDMERMAASGLPIEGTRGEGYTMADPISLPPLTLTTQELEALQTGLAIISEATDRELQSGARSLARKIESITPDHRTALPDGWADAIYPFADTAPLSEHMPVLRQAIRQKRKIWLVYKDQNNRPSQRMIRPLQLEYWGRVWSCVAWCETRKAFDSFRVARMQTAELTSARFRDEEGKTFKDYLAALKSPPD